MTTTNASGDLSSNGTNYYLSGSNANLPFITVSNVSTPIYKPQPAAMWVECHDCPTHPTHPLIWKSKKLQPDHSVCA